MTKVVWRPFYEPAALKQLEDMKTLDRFETDVDARFVKPHEIIEQVAVVEYASSPDYFDRPAKITVLEPAACAGDWDVHVDYNPEFTARKATDGA